MKKFLSCFCAAILVCFAALPVHGVIAVGSAVSPVAIENVTFYMEKGASVRTVEGSSGLRFTSIIDKTEYLGLKSNADYVSLTFGMLIAPYDYIETYGELNEESVFGESAVYNPTDEGEGVKILDIYAEDMHDCGDGHMCFNGVIMNIFDKNFARDFYGIGYIKAQTENGYKYKFAAENDNVRSVAYVAGCALLNGESGAVLENYISVCADLTTEYTVETYLCAEEEILQSSEKIQSKIGAAVVSEPTEIEGYTFDAKRSVTEAKALAGGKTVLKLYYEKDGMAARTVGGVYTDFDLSEDTHVLDVTRFYGKVTEINGVTVDAGGGNITMDTATLREINASSKNGERKWTIATDKDRVYNVTVCLADKLLSGAADLTALSDNPSGYYVLAGNIYGAGDLYVESFNGTLDGRGYKITDINATVAEGLFVSVGSKGVIKNAAFVNVNSEKCALSDSFSGRLENVFVSSATATRVIETLCGTADKFVAVLYNGRYLINNVSENSDLGIAVDNAYACLGKGKNMFGEESVADYIGLNCGFHTDLRSLFSAYGGIYEIGGPWSGENWILKLGDNFVITV